MAKRGPYAKGSAKRQEILDRALEVIERDGYTQLSVREIARESGLSQAGLLHYFSTREDLFVEVVRRRDDSQQRHLDPVDPIGGLVEAMRINSASPGLVRMLVAVSIESTDLQHPGHAYFTYRYARLRSLIGEAIRGQQQHGEFPADRDADATAVAFIALADGLQIQWLLDPTIDMALRLDDIWELMRRT